jgi:hypothetical protein
MQWATGPGMGGCKWTTDHGPNCPKVVYDTESPLLFHMFIDPAEGLPLSGTANNTVDPGPTDGLPVPQAEIDAALAKLVAAYKNEVATFTYGHLIAPTALPGEANGQVRVCCDKDPFKPPPSNFTCDCNGPPFVKPPGPPRPHPPSPAPAPPGPPVSPWPASNYLGCWKDKMKGERGSGPENAVCDFAHIICGQCNGTRAAGCGGYNYTLEGCNAACTANSPDWLFFGVQNGGKGCFCGGSYGHFGTDNACSEACHGDARETGGGGSQNSVWKIVR